MDRFMFAARFMARIMKMQVLDSELFGTHEKMRCRLIFRNTSSSSCVGRFGAFTNKIMSIEYAGGTAASHFRRG
jgi:hypothetical protein